MALWFLMSLVFISGSSEISVHFIAQQSQFSTILKLYCFCLNGLISFFCLSYISPLPSSLLYFSSSIYLFVIWLASGMQCRFVGVLVVYYRFLDFLHLERQKWFPVLVETQLQSSECLIEIMFWGWMNFSELFIVSLQDRAHRDSSDRESDSLNHEIWSCFFCDVRT